MINNTSKFVVDIPIARTDYIITLKRILGLEEEGPFKGFLKTSLITETCKRACKCSSSVTSVNTIL